jgi:hypothetical protein
MRTALHRYGDRIRRIDVPLSDVRAGHPSKNTAAALAHSFRILDDIARECEKKPGRMPGLFYC